MMPHLFALAAAVTYATAALLIKRATDLGAGSLRILVVSNVVAGLMFLPLLGFGGEVHWPLIWQPIAVAGCFVAGQWLTFLALQKGDVSIATPAMGVKILLVPVLLTMIAGQSLPPKLWAGAALATLGVVFLSRRPVTRHHHIGLTIILATLAACAYALFDILVQMWSPKWGLGRFLPIALGCAGLMSLVLLPKLKPIQTSDTRKAWTWLLLGAVAIGMQALLIVYTIAHWGRAEQANVIYSSRGIWSIAMVWIAGHLLHIHEKSVGAQIMAWRMAGAILMMAGIVLVLVD